MADRPDWAGFFSDPIVRQLKPEEFSEAYQMLADEDPEMSGFRPEDHKEFFEIMSKEHSPYPPELGEAESAVLGAFAPLMGRTPEEQGQIGQALVAEQVGGEMAATPVGQAIGAGGALAQPWFDSITGTYTRTREGLGEMLSALTQAIPGVAETMLAPAQQDSNLWDPVRGWVQQVSEDVDAGVEMQREERAQEMDQQNAVYGAMSRALFGEDSRKTIDQVWGEATKGEFGNLPEYAYDSVVNAIVSMGPVAAANMIPGVGQAVGGTMLLSQIAGEQIQDIRQHGGEGQGAAENLADALLPSALERIGLGKVFGKLPNRLAKRGGIVGWLTGRAQNTAEAALTEGITELGQQAWNINMRRQSLGVDPLTPYTDEEKAELRESFAAGAIGGGAVGGGIGAVTGQQTPQEEGLQDQKIADLVSAVLEPERAAEEGKLRLMPEPGQVTGGEARLRALESLPFELGERDVKDFVSGKPLDVARIATERELPEQDVVTAIDEAEQRVPQFAPRQPVQPSPEADEVVSAISSGLEELAIEAETGEHPMPALAESRRRAARQIEVVEPETQLERGIVSYIESKKLGGSPRVQFFRHGGGVKLDYDGVFVRPGLIAIDITDSNAAPKAMVGALYHELLHNTEATNPVAYNAAMEVIKETPLWERARARLEEAGVPATDKEIFSSVTQLPDVTSNLIRTIAEYADVEDIAKAPSKVRAVYEWLAGAIRKIFKLDAKTEGLNLVEMERFTAFRQDPEMKRNAARYALELVDMLQAPDVSAAPATPTTPEFSRTFEQLRRDEGMTPRALDSITTETSRFFQVKDSLAKDLAKGGVKSEDVLKRAAKGANEWVRRNMKILDPEDLDADQTMLTEYAQALGVQVNFYEGGHKDHGGHFISEGQIWVNANNKTGWTFQQIVAHEMMHDFKRRYPAMWRKIVDKAIELMPEEWAEARKRLLKYDAYNKLGGEALHNEQLAFLIHFNANEFWAAVVRAGRQEDAPVAFTRFYEYIGGLIKKVTHPLREWAQTIGIIGVATDMDTPAGQLGRFVVEQFAKTTAEVDGPYQVYSPKKHEARLKEKQETYRKAITKKGLEQAPIAGRVAADLERGLAPQPEQLPLFSRRAGYPPAAQTPQQLGAWRRKLGGMVWRGEKGKFWYELSSEAMLIMTGGDREMARKFARVVAVYSPKAPVMVNWHRALTAWHRYVAGYSKEDFLKEQLGFKTHHEQAAAILYDDAPWSGEKTNSFFTNLFTMVEGDLPDRATIDVWMMRAMGFSGDAPNPAQYRAMEKEVKRVAKKLGVETHQAQAMIWVYAKTVWEDPDFVKSVLRAALKADMVTHEEARDEKGKIIMLPNDQPKMVWTPQYNRLYREMYAAELKRDLKADTTKYPLSAASLITFATALQAKVAVISQEAIPGVGWLAGLADADIAAKVGFTLAVEQALMDENGDIIAQELGMGPIADLNTMLLGNSAYFDGERVQINPSRQIEVPAAAQRGAEATFTWEPASKQQAMIYAVIRGMLTGQESVAGYRRFLQDPVVAERNMAEMITGARLTVDQQSELVRALSDKLGDMDLDGWEIALYPTRDGVAFMNTRHTGMSNVDFHAVVKEVIGGLSFSGKMKTFGADSFYVTSEPSEVDGKVEDPYYAEVIQGYDKVLRRVEKRVADKLAKVYTEYAGRGFGEAPDWAVAHLDTDETLRRDAKSYPHFWHFSVEEVAGEGILRERAGTGATGPEAARFRFDEETGKLDPETAVVHLYTAEARPEAVVVSKAKFVNKVIADLKLIPTDSTALADLYRKHDNDIVKVMKDLRSRGYDGMVDVNRGMVQVNRDIDTSELVEGHELTADERRAWKGALKLDEMEDEKQYDHLNVSKASEITDADIEYVASRLKEDGTAYFHKGIDEARVKQYFGEVRSTSVGLVATKPRAPQYSRRVDQSESAPIGMEDVVVDEQAFGTLYSPAQRSATWSLPRMGKWERFLKRWQDSFVQFQRLNEVIEAEGYDIADHINTRLQEELYHGRTQEQAARIEAKYLVPLLRELKALISKRPETREQLVTKFEEFLQARHTPERNAHIREAYVNRKITQLEDRRDKLLKRIKELSEEMMEAEGPLHEERLSNTMRWYEAQLVNVESAMEAVLNQKELTSGMTDKQAAGVMKQTRLDGLDKIFGRLAAKYIDRMLKERLDTLLTNGLISQEEYDNVAIYKYYVPLKYKNVDGDLQDLLDAYTSMRSSNGFDVRGPELAHVTGMEPGTSIHPIIAAAFNETLAAYDRVERNKVAISLLDMAERFPNEKIWQVNKEVKKRVFDKKTGTIKEADDWWARNQANVIAAKRDGQTYFITLRDPGMIDAMKGLGTENIHRWVRALRGFVRTLAQLYTTWSAEFILTNFARDWQQAIVSSTTDLSAESARRIAANAHRAVRGILAANFPDRYPWLLGQENEYTEAYHELKEVGGKVGFFGMRGIEDQHAAILKELGTTRAAMTLRGARRLGNYISSLNEATENGIRLATYVEARRVGASKEVAASLAKNVTVNFNRRGDASGVMGAFYLFFNAGVQGVNRFFRSMQTPQGQRLAAATIAASFALHTFSRAIMGQDEDGEDEYDKVSDFTKGRNWVIGYAKGKYIQVPMPYGFGVWGQLGKELEHLVFSGDDRSEAATEAAVRMLAGLTTHFSPVGETSFNQGMYALSRPVIPTVFEPWTDILANETYWGGKVYPAKTPWDQRASSWRTYPARTVLEKTTQGLTRKLNALTGGSAYRSGLIDINADGLSYVLESYVGPTGRFVKRPFELLQKKIEGEDDLWNDWIILRRFLGETAPQYYVPGEFYDAIADVGAAVEEEAWMMENGMDMERWERRHGWKVGLKKEASRAQRDIRELRKVDPDSMETRELVLQVQQDFISSYLTEAKR